MGNPNPFCACKICKKAASDWSSKDFRMRPSILIETSGQKILVDPTPDLRLQMVKFGIHDFDAILITHWHYDHMYSLCELETWRNKQNVKVYCVKAIADAIQKSLFWVGLKPEVIGAGESFRIGEIKITSFEVKHTARWTGVNCTGFVFEENGKRLTYVPDFYELPEASLKLIRSPNVLIIGGLYVLEMNLKEHERYQKDPDHLHGKQVFEVIEKINPKKTYLVHICDVSGKSHSELQASMPKDVYVSYDGLQLNL